jgi:hypothetical protein
MTQQEFKVGDKVFDILFGWGEVVHVDSLIHYPIEVDFENDTANYMRNGKYMDDAITPTLSHTEYRLTSEPTFPRIMEVGLNGQQWAKKLVLCIYNDRAYSLLDEPSQYVNSYPHYREIEPKTKLTLAEIAEKFGLEADKIEIVS